MICYEIKFPEQLPTKILGIEYFSRGFEKLKAIHWLVLIVDYSKLFSQFQVFINLCLHTSYGELGMCQMLSSNIYQEQRQTKPWQEDMGRATTTHRKFSANG